jgi:hypothetical protein
MKLVVATILATRVALIARVRCRPAPQRTQCDVPQSFIRRQRSRARDTNEVKDPAPAGYQRDRFGIVGAWRRPRRRALCLSGTARGSAQAAPAGRHRNQGYRARSVAADHRRNGAGPGKILADDKPALVIWQAGTADALSGVEPEDFARSLDDGVERDSGRRRRRHPDEHAIQPAHRIDARRLGLCRRHAVGRPAARRVVVRSPWRSCITGTTRDVRPLYRHQEL